MENLGGDVVVLAGATGRVGGETLRVLSARGAYVVLISRSKSRGEALLGNLDPDAHARVRIVEADLSEADSGTRLAKTALGWHGRVDGVISLAGGGSAFTSIVESTYDDMEMSVRNNLLVAYNLFVPLLRHMLKQPMAQGARSRGRLVAVTAGTL